MEKLILVDCDGVLLNWEYAFHIFMKGRGHKRTDPRAYRIVDQYNGNCGKYVKLFNESAAMGFLPPHRDAPFYIDLLHRKHGYVFHVVSSFSEDKYAGELRIMNLEKLFGKTCFEGFTFLPTGADKDDALEKYRDSGLFFVEDKLDNAQTAHKLGLRPILMEHVYNMHYDEEDFPVITCWKDFYMMIDK